MPDDISCPFAYLKSKRIHLYQLKNIYMFRTQVQKASTEKFIRVQSLYFIYFCPTHFKTWPFHTCRAGGNLLISGRCR